MNTKQIWPDYLRAIATIAVIMLHVSAPILGQFNELQIYTWNIGNFYDSLTRFCVPIFFMLSGALLLNKDYELKYFIKKRFLRIIPPFIFWSLVYVIYDIIERDKDFNSVIEMVYFFIRKIFHGGQYHLWFIYTIMGLYLFVPILRKWIKNSTKKEILYFLIIWVITIIYGIPHLKGYLPKIYLVNFSGYLGYMVLGYYLSQLKQQKNYLSIIYIVLGVSITIIGTYFLTTKSSSFNGYFYGYLTPNVLIVSIGIFLLFKELKIKSKRINTVLEYISRYSFGIYLSHVLVLKLLTKIGLNWSFTNAILSIPLVTMATITISALIIHFGKKIIYVSKLID